MSDYVFTMKNLESAVQECDTQAFAIAAVLLDIAQSLRTIAEEKPGVFYGACGVAGCARCRPLFDADNNEIPNTGG